MRLISEMPAVFSWQTGASLQAQPGSIYNRFARSMRIAFEDWVEDAPSISDRVRWEIAWGFHQLDEEAQLRALTAPEMYRRIIDWSHRSPLDTPRFVQDAIRAERFRRSGQSESDLPYWSALGERCDPSASGPDAVRISGIVVDSRSPYAQVSSNQPAQGYAVAEEEAMGRRFTRILEHTGSVAPAAGDLVHTVTRVLLLRQDSVESFGSSSWPFFVGRMSFINAHLTSVADAQIANGFVHEAIHGLLYMVENEEPFYVDPAPGRTFQITSPWSGRDLFLASFLHACFVWYGLRMFWEQPASHSFGECDAQDCLRRSDSGFRKGPLTRLLAPVRSSLRPELLTTIAVMQEAVLDLPTMMQSAREVSALRESGAAGGR